MILLCAVVLTSILGGDFRGFQNRAVRNQILTRLEGRVQMFDGEAQARYLLELVGNLFRFCDGMRKLITSGKNGIERVVDPRIIRKSVRRLMTRTKELLMLPVGYYVMRGILSGFCREFKQEVTRVVIEHQLPVAFN